MARGGGIGVFKGDGEDHVLAEEDSDAVALDPAIQNRWIQKKQAVCAHREDCTASHQ